MPRGRPKGQVSTGPLELVGLLRLCEWIAREKINVPFDLSDGNRKPLCEALAYYFATNGKPYPGYKTRKRDELGDHYVKWDTLCGQLVNAAQIREATPKAWGCLVSAWTTMCRPEDVAAAAAQDVTPEELIATNMVLFVVAGIVDEREVETLYANLGALYHQPDFYMGTWITVVRRIKERSGVADLRDLPPLLRQSG